jgi:uncharacterized protein YjiS (DUF1127 family)
MSMNPFTTTSDDHDGENALQRIFQNLSNRFHALQERLIIRETLEDLGQLDDTMLRDIGATSDEIYRVHQMRNGQRPTLATG